MPKRCSECKLPGVHLPECSHGPAPKEATIAFINKLRWLRQHYLIAFVVSILMYLSYFVIGPLSVLLVMLFWLVFSALLLDMMYQLGASVFAITCRALLFILLSPFAFILILPAAVYDRRIYDKINRLENAWNNA